LFFNLFSLLPLTSKESLQKHFFPNAPTPLPMKKIFFLKHLLSAYYVPGAILNPGDTVMNNTDSTLTELTI